jgi:hypothetical protein
MEPPKRHQITVTARASFVPEQSDEQEGRYVFAYTISILNSGTVAARLISRHWIITDSDNQVQEVRGLGVVGDHRHAGGHHARQLPHGGRGRHRLRGVDPGIHAFHAAHAALRVIADPRPREAAGACRAARSTTR